MPFDGIVTANVANELNNLLEGGRIDKIYQPEQDEIVLSVHRGKEKYKVFLTSNSSDARIQLISETPPNPVTPPAFCMLLRKHLQGGKINKIIQKDTERIIEFCVDSFNELGYPTTKKIITEIMGKHSNISLIDMSTGKIIDSIKRVSFDVNRFRQILPGMTYIYPPTQDKIPFYDINEEQFIEIINSSNTTISKTLVNSIMGFSPFAAVLISSRAEISSDTHCTLLDEIQKKSIYNAFSSLINDIKDKRFEPCVWMNSDGIPADFYCFSHPDYDLSYEKYDFNEIDEAEEFYYTRKKTTNKIKQKASDIDKILNVALDKLYLKKSRLSEDILQAENSDIYRLKGELIFANIHCIKQGLSSIELLNYYENKLINITLDPRLSPSENGQKYYKKYNKLKTAIVEKNIQLDETEKDIAYLESVKQLLEEATDFNDVEEIRNELINENYIKRKSSQKRKKSLSSPAHEYRTSEGFRILAGRNNKQNDILTLKTAGSKDIWFHTKDIPGTHVILFTEGKKPSEKSLFEAASIAAFYSKGKMSENVPVDYTYVKYVKKPSGAKPGMVIFDHNKTLYVNPMIPENSTLFEHDSPNM